MPEGQALPTAQEELGRPETGTRSGPDPEAARVYLLASGASGIPCQGEAPGPDWDWPSAGESGRGGPLLGLPDAAEMIKLIKPEQTDASPSGRCPGEKVHHVTQVAVSALRGAEQPGADSQVLIRLVLQGNPGSKGHGAPPAPSHLAEKALRKVLPPRG